MPGILKLPGLESINGENMTLDTLNKKCEACGLFLKRIDFHKNNSKNDGLQNRCKDCMYDYKIKLRKGLIEKQTLIKRDSYFIPDIYLVGYGRQQTYQNCNYNMQNAKKFLPLHIDHIKPWSSQGGNALSNLVVSCQECNLLASNKWFSSFEEKKDYIIFEKKKRTFHDQKNSS